MPIISGGGGSADLSTAAILAPAASTRNVIQPTGAAIIPLIVKGFAAQSADLQQWQSSAGAIGVAVTAAGALALGANEANLFTVDVNDNLFLSNNASAGAAGIFFRTKSGFSIQSGGGNPYFAVDTSGGTMTATLAASLIFAQNFGSTGTGTIQTNVSDGAAAVGLILDTGAALANAGAKLVSVKNNAVEKLSISKDGLLTWIAGNEQTTVGAAGAASALPLAPTKYLKIKDSAGTTLVVPCYAAA